MNTKTIARIEELGVSSRRYVKTPTNGNENNKGKKYRRGKNYAKDAEVERQNYIKKQQRKSGKVDYRRGQYANKPAEIVAVIEALNEVKKSSNYADAKETKRLINAALNEIKKYKTRDNASYVTTRHYEMPTHDDTKLEDQHYANFLGDKYGDNNAPYQKSVVKLRYCDSMRNDYDLYQRAKYEQERQEELHNAWLYEMYNQARLQQEEQERLEEEEEDMSKLEYETQSKNYFIFALMRSGNFDYDEAFELVDYLFTQKYSVAFNDEDWLPWLAKFGITPVDLYGESYY